jgi:hypothetical protein
MEKLELDDYSGKVVSKTFGKGSKSQHEAMFLETPKGAFKLRRRGGNPFRDQVLEGLREKSIHCKGVIRNSTLFMEEWEVDS